MLNKILGICPMRLTDSKVKAIRATAKRRTVLEGGRFGGQVMGPQLFKSLFQTFNVLPHYA